MINISKVEIHHEQSIHDAPNENAVRQNVAEWCRLNGHVVRADLIEKQLALALLAYNPNDFAFDLSFDIRQLTKKMQEAG